MSLAMNHPRVSVLTATRNRAHLLPATIDSVLCQSLSDFEMILVDDGSTDDTRGVVESYRDPRLRFVGQPRIGNLSKLRNLGVEQARAEYVAFLDSDDLWHEDKLRLQVEALEQHPHAGWSFCGYESFNEQGPLRRNLYPDHPEIASVFFSLIRSRMTIYPSTLLARRELLDRVGAFDETFLVGDFELLTRLAFASEAALLHLPLARIRKHDGNTSTEPEWAVDGYQDAIRSVESFYARGAIPQDVRSEILRHHYDRLGGLLVRQGRRTEARRVALDGLRLRPWSLRGWARYASTFLPTVERSAASRNDSSSTSTGRSQV